MGSDAANDVLARLESLRPHQQDGHRAPHKPLLALLAMGRLTNTGSSELPWSVAEVALADLLAEFGGSPGRVSAQSAAYPFTRLRADGVWILDAEVPMDLVRPLNDQHVTGRLEPTIEAALLADPALVREAARMLVTSNFPDAIAPDVLKAVGFDPDIVLTAEVARPDAQYPVGERRVRPIPVELSDYLDLTIGRALPQFRALLERRPVSEGRQVPFLPVETLLCLAAAFVVNHRSFGGATADRAPEPVPSLAHLFSRRPSSILAKMANLDGSRSHGARWDALAGASLREQPAHFAHVYRVLLHAARAEGIGPDRLPDFLGLENGGEFALLGQGELGVSEIDDLKEQAARWADEDDSAEEETERIMLAAARVGQHLFALNVLRNCGNRCVFCGLNPSMLGTRRMLVAGHIKPWKDSSSKERLDLRNGLAACPAHDVAFDTGLLTVDRELHIHLTRSLADAVQADHLARQYYGRPPLLDALLFPEGAHLPNPKYLEWHRQYIFVSS